MPPRRVAEIVIVVLGLLALFGTFVLVFVALRSFAG